MADDPVKALAAQLAAQKRREEAALAARMKQRAEMGDDDDDDDDSDESSSEGEWLCSEQSAPVDIDRPCIYLWTELVSNARLHRPLASSSRNDTSNGPPSNQEDPPVKMNQYVLRQTLGQVHFRSAYHPARLPRWPPCEKVVLSTAISAERPRDRVAPFRRDGGSRTRLRVQRSFAQRQTRLTDWPFMAIGPSSADHDTTITTIKRPSNERWIQGSFAKVRLATTDSGEKFAVRHACTHSSAQASMHACRVCADTIYRASAPRPYL